MATIEYKEDVEELSITTKRYSTEWWTFTLTEEASDKLREKVELLAAGRKDWITPLFETIISKMKFKLIEGRKISVAELEYEETIKGIAEMWIQRNNVDTTSPQATLVEAQTQETE